MIISIHIKPPLVHITYRVGRVYGFIGVSLLECDVISIVRNNNFVETVSEPKKKTPSFEKVQNFQFTIIASNKLFKV